MKKPSLIKRFFSFLLRTVVVILLMVLIAVGSFEGVTYYLTGSIYDLRELLKNSGSAVADIAETVAKDDDTVDDKNISTSLFFVESADGLSRYTSLIMTNSSTGAVDILLAPLHAQVTVGGELLADLQKKIPNAGSTMELDDIARAYGDEKYDIISRIYGQTLGINIGGYEVLTQKQFEKLLDLTSSVTYHFDNQISYRDARNQLKIMEAGDQQLNGSKAMIMLGHLDGSDKQESDRLEHVNSYLESWLAQVLSSGKGKELVSRVAKNAVTSPGKDFDEAQEIWGKLSMNAVTLRILQGAESGGLFALDSQKARLQVATLIKQSGEYSASGDQDSVGNLGDEYGTTESSKDYYIELYNAAFQQGLASSWEEYLEGQGYNISLISNYQDEGPISTTRIIVNREGIGLDLLKYFPGADIQTGEIVTGGDIQVYIGTDSISVGTSEGTDQDYQGDSDSYGTTEDYSYDSSGVQDSNDSDFSEQDSYQDNDSSGDQDTDTDQNSYQDSSETGNSGSGSYNFDTDSE
ncbi:MAG: LytR C-terminal domain-containing protein [Eubacterium sp.]|nr:LytR C-terminal domain-containing protein [Eubacterium sp.]